ncbi:hypothetical protein BJX99DRAFT_221597 [Aspergillus californicus]
MAPFSRLQIPLRVESKVMSKGAISTEPLLGTESYICVGLALMIFFLIAAYRHNKNRAGRSAPKPKDLEQSYCPHCFHCFSLKESRLDMAQDLSTDGTK